MALSLCRTAISDMVVRGAPAIAMAAALSLAVEVESLKPATSETGQEAVAFLKNRLDYLVSRFVTIFAVFTKSLDAFVPLNVM